MHILTGTASWTDPTLLACGRFYPPQVRTPEARLRHYANRFGLAEVDATYYGMPSGHMAHLWASRTPAGFTFNIKAFRLFTGHPAPLRALPSDIRRELGGASHDRDDWDGQGGQPVQEGPYPAHRPARPDAALFYNQLPADLQDELWRRFLIALEPLRMAGKLGAVHFQFAPWVQCNARGQALVGECARHMDEHLMSVEFRHRSWFGTPAASVSTLAFERELGAVHTVVDAPQGFDNTVPAVWETTHPDLAVLRLHGRNAAAWNNQSGASSGRFQYEYTPAELAELAERLKRLAEQVRKAHAVLNTNYQDQGMQNATRLAAALASARVSGTR
ncbi:DUF72 domain-containing protein [Bordetella sp. BOR01]|uniref:DUF72 domain-containing protein n=1 Tax=Bordetella sp. BOR01 TaxID=2854779 RepID=UPI001C466A67|nr:DUF72 domain-containing protein [Bordetella sp. BOR01]MBV7486632.1 DUF72 domain-containing protein [Bordetella sp. BOR01]